MDPPSIFEYTNYPSLFVSLFSLCLNTACLCLCHSMAFKPFGAVCSFPLLGSLTPNLCPLKSHPSIKQSLLNGFKDGGHLFCNGRYHRRVKNPKIVVLCLHREIHSNTVKSTKTPFSRLEILLIPPYNSIGSTFISLLHVHH